MNSFKDNGSILSQYFKRLGIVRNDWLILSFLQHHGAGTPLLDFTKQFNTALFFAFDKINLSGQGDLDHFVSVYYYKAVDVANGISTSIYKLAKKEASNFTEWDKHGQLWTDLSYLNVMRQHKTILVPTYSTQSNLSNRKRTLISIYTVANLNSTAQEGEFVCNRDSQCPLEDIWIREDAKYLSCIDIHKGLYDYILYKYLKVKSVEAARMKYYPNEQDLAWEIQSSALTFKA